MDAVQSHQHTAALSTPIRVPRIQVLHVLFWMAFAALLTPLHFLLMPYFRKEEGLIYHYNILEGTVLSPFAQRVLLPRLVDMFTGDAWGVVYAMSFLSVFTLAAAHVGVFAWMRVNGVSARRAFVGVFAVLYLLPIWYNSYIGIAYPQTEVVLIILALFAMRSRWHVALAVLVVIGTLNRETTGVYIVALYAMVARNLKGITAYTLLFGATYAILKVAAPGVGMWGYGFGQLARQLETEQLQMVLFYQLVFAPLWIMLIVRARRAPPLLARVSWLLPVNVVLFLIFGNWTEVRLLMPAILVVALPIALVPARGRDPVMT